MVMELILKSLKNNDDLMVTCAKIDKFTSYGKIFTKLISPLLKVNFTKIALLSFEWNAIFFVCFLNIQSLYLWNFLNLLFRTQDYAYFQGDEFDSLYIEIMIYRLFYQFFD